KYLPQLRNLYNLYANKSGTDPDPVQLVDRVAARNVVDGKALLIAFNQDQIPFATDPELPDPGTPDHVALTGHIDRLNELFDAVSDLLTAESMYQLAQGNVIAARAASDALISGGRPP